MTITFVFLLALAGILVAIAGLTGREMREDARRQDRVARLFRDPYCRDRCDEQ